MAQNSRIGKVGPSLCTVPQPRNWDEIKPGGCQRREDRGYVNWEAKLRKMKTCSFSTVQKYLCILHWNTDKAPQGTSAGQGKTAGWLCGSGPVLPWPAWVEIVMEIRLTLSDYFPGGGQSALVAGCC